MLSLPEREVHRTRAARMEKAVRTHVGTFKHTDGVHKLQAEFSRNFQAFMEGAPPPSPQPPVLAAPRQSFMSSAMARRC